MDDFETVEEQRDRLLAAVVKLEDCVLARDLENVRLRAVVARLGEWTHSFGSELNPRGADTYGEGVRHCKSVVADILGSLSESNEP